MMCHEHPDHASERWAALDDERVQREQQSDRLADYTPATGNTAAKGADGPRVNTATVALAWAVHKDPSDPAMARALARLIIDASESPAVKP